MDWIDTLVARLDSKFDAPNQLEAVIREAYAPEAAKVKPLVEAGTEVFDCSDNEATAHPYWAIVKPAGFGYTVLLKGFWFSREKAESFLNATRHRYGKSAYVFCFSGHESDWERLRVALRQALAAFEVTE